MARSRAAFFPIPLTVIGARMQFSMIVMWGNRLMQTCMPGVQRRMLSIFFG